MNRFHTTVTDRSLIKRAGFVFISLLLMAAYVTIYSPNRAQAAACTPPTTDYGTATATINVANSTTYRIWSNIQAPDASNNSYMLEVDGNNCYIIGDSNNIQAGVWTWVDYQNGSTTSTKAQQSLSAGNHTLKMIGREPGVKLGRILLVSDLNCVPTGNGDNCATSADTEAPSIDITTPVAGATVQGAVNVTAAATDNVGVTKVEFYVNGTLKQTDTSAPYAYSWDSLSVANGSVSLMAKAYDVAGNASSDTVQVQTSNGDTAAPSVPTNVKATANAYNKVTVTWTASTDNTAVAGYRVLRNGVTVAQVTSGAQYIDNSVLPGNTYSYQVSAYDAAGNASALSPSSQVQTPSQPDTQAPSAPAGLTAKAVSASQINLTWTASTDNIGVASYAVYRSVGGGSPVKVGTTTTTSFGDTGLAQKTAYTYYVTASDSAGNVSANSQNVTATTNAKPTPSKRGSLKGTVTFSRNSDKHAHVVIRVNGVRQIYDTSSTGAYTINNLPAGTYKVRYEAQGSYSKIVTLKVEAGKTKTQNVTLRKR